LKLLRRQENDLFNIILQGGFSPSHFDLERDYTNEKITIKHKDSNFIFRFRFYARSHELYFTEVNFTPGSKTEFETHHPNAQWSHLSEYLLNWLFYLDQELGEPDKWAGLFESSGQIGWTSDDGDNRPFTYIEVQEVDAAINRAKSGIRELELPDETMKFIEARLDYIAEKSKTLGKVDWKNIFLGTMIGTIVQLALPNETGQAIWTLLKEAFKRVFLISLG
jgi:hypothetical protein